MVRPFERQVAAALAVLRAAPGSVQRGDALTSLAEWRAATMLAAGADPADLDRNGRYAPSWSRGGRS
jgi:hypothetical protein